MNCGEFQLAVIDLARGAIADTVIATRCLAHAADCPRCAEQLLEQQKLSVGFGAWAALAEQEHAPNRIEQVLRREFPAQLFAAPGRIAPTLNLSAASSGAKPYQTWWAGAIAAAVLLAALVPVIKWRKPLISLDTQQAPKRVAKVSAGSQAEGVRGPTGPLPASNDESGARRVVSTSASPAGRAGVKHPAPRNKAGALRSRRSQPRPAIPNGSRDVYATDFLPLPYGSGLSLDEGWELVRVSMPRSALASLGIALPDDQPSSERVKADVVLADDGLARAIRFVQ